MHLSISLDPTGTGPRGESAQAYRARAAQLDALSPDLVLLAAEDAAGRIAPPTVEALIDVAWMTGVLRTATVVAGLPALHSLPFHVARALSAADFLSGGRTGYLPLLGGGQAHDAAYGTGALGEAAARGDDFIRATQALWDSWDDDAVLLDKAGGRYLDSGRVRRVDYRGPFFATMGPLNAARPPQGHPLLVRDLADAPDSAVAADIVIGDADALAAAPAGPVRLLRTLADPAAAAERARSGVADGLHLAGPDAVAMLTALRADASRGEAESGRARFRLPAPKNPFSQKVAA